jgi:hypothetical protein
MTTSFWLFLLAVLGGREKGYPEMAKDKNGKKTILCKRKFPSIPVA